MCMPVHVCACLCMFVLGYVIFKQKYKMIENGKVDGDIKFTCPKKMLNFPQKNYTQ